MTSAAPLQFLNLARERSDATNASAGYWATIDGRPHSAANRVFGKDDVMVFGERHAERMLRDYLHYYQGRPAQPPP